MNRTARKFHELFKKPADEKAITSTTEFKALIEEDIYIIGLCQKSYSKRFRDIADLFYDVSKEPVNFRFLIGGGLILQPMKNFEQEKMIELILDLASKNATESKITVLLYLILMYDGTEKIRDYLKTLPPIANCSETFKNIIQEKFYHSMFERKRLIEHAKQVKKENETLAYFLVILAVELWPGQKNESLIDSGFGYRDCGSMASMRYIIYDYAPVYLDMAQNFEFANQDNADFIKRARKPQPNIFEKIINLFR